MSVWRVALPVAGAEVYDYRALKDEGTCIVGRGITVPFGRRELNGVVVEVCEHSDVPAEKQRSASQLHPRRFDNASLELLRFCARHYRYPLGLCLSTALPSGMVTFRPPVERHYAITSKGRDALSSKNIRGSQQKIVLQQLSAQTGFLARPDLAVSDSVLQALLRKDWVQREERERSIASTTPTADSLTLRPEQQNAVQQIDASHERYRCFLLRGATGSGKTEVYLTLAERAIQRGGQVLMLVPEIALTPQMIERVRARVPGRIAVVHSQLADGERRCVWHAALNGRIDFVLATRSGIFLPMPNLQLLVVDEEHESSYKQQDGLRYSARDLAVYRGQLQNAPVVLGSATPALESLHNAANGRYQLLDLPAPARGRQDLRLVDIRPFPANMPLSPPLQQLMQEHLSQDGQIFLFLNRRGYAPVLYCADCQWYPLCTHCDSPMVWHRQENLLRCHHCGTAQPVPRHCESCGSSDLVPVGWGTQRIIEAVEQSFPRVAAVRFDRDSMRGKGTLESTLEDIRENRARIIVGTQMLAKGHDFPKLSLVAVLDTDGGLFATDFRAPERLGQLLTQVRGRAGRRAQDAACVIQTRSPTHPYLQSWLTGGYRGLAERLLVEREETGWPPFSFLAAVRAEAVSSEALDQFWSQLEQSILWPQEDVERLGPISQPRRAGRYRSHLLLRSKSRPLLNPTLNLVRNTLDTASWSRKVRWSLDIDPWTLD